MRLCLEPDAAGDDMENLIRRKFREVAEVTPNSISYHDPEEMRRLHGVGKALKEEKIVDRRKDAGSKKRIGRPRKRRRRNPSRRQPA